jgi:hypothetical protein
MKKYFENDEIILPFSSVHSVTKVKDENKSFCWVTPLQHNIFDYSISFPKEQLNDYLLWLERIDSIKSDRSKD